MMLSALDHVIQHTIDVREQVFNALDHDSQTSIAVQGQFQNEIVVLFESLNRLRLEIRRAMEVPDVTIANLTLTGNFRNLLEMSLRVYVDLLDHEQIATNKLPEGERENKRQLGLIEEILSDLNTGTQGQ